MSELDDPRVLFSSERTLLAWNRTSLSLIAFGFLVERSGLLLPQAAPMVTSTDTITFWVGLAFIALGVVSAWFSAQQYKAVLRTLKPSEIPQGYMPRWGMLVNWIVCLLGAALCAVLFIGRS